jgi:hypothetical protein
MPTQLDSILDSIVKFGIAGTIQWQKEIVSAKLDKGKLGRIRKMGRSYQIAL